MSFQIIIYPYDKDKKKNEERTKKRRERRVKNCSHSIHMMFRVFLFLILFNNQIHGKFFFHSDNSPMSILRHTRLITDNQYYFIHCPYNLNYLTLQFLNYSNKNCFNLYSPSTNQTCPNHQSPCQFQAKSIQLYCNYYSYSNSVDITYQCSYKYFQKTQFSHSSTNPNEILSLILIALGLMTILGIFSCCIWFICCHQLENHDQSSSI